MDNLKHIAIVVAFNDLQFFHGGSKNGIKSSTSYFDQLLMLFLSIKDNWQEKYFTYDLYAFHSLPLEEKKTAALKKLGVNVRKVTYSEHENKIRPLAYSIPLDCNFRLVLDTDMLALKEPKFNFKYDFQATYGGNKYNREQWEEICDFLDCEFPEGVIHRKNKGNYNHFSFDGHFRHHNRKFYHKKEFPYFNNGAILIRNDISDKFMNLWEQFKRDYTVFIRNTYKTEIDLEGQDVVGLALANVASKWKPFPKGFNFILQDSLPLGRQLISQFKGKAFLIHYIHTTDQNPYFNIIEEYHLKAKEYLDQIV